MNHDSHDPKDAANRRFAAEARLRVRKASLGTEEDNSLTEADLRRLRHELEVHQIELEMQNEELCRSQSELQTALQNYTELYDFAPTGYFILDAGGSIRSVNLTGSRLLGMERSRLLNRRFGALVSEEDLPAINEFLRTSFAEEGPISCEVSIPKGSESSLMVRLESQGPNAGDQIRVAVLDITERHRAMDERDRLIAELQDALAHVRKLSGMLPICAHCKKIRGDKGYWENVDTYIAEHSEAIFSHGLCPECIPLFFPNKHGEA